MMYIILIIIFGLIIGSFLTMLVHRMPIMLLQDWYSECQTFLKEYKPTSDKLNLALPCSHCPHCKTPIHWYHNIPLFGYMMQLGRCQHCHHKISLRYPLIELLAVLLPLLCFIHWGVSTQFYAATVLSWGLIVQSYIDIEHQIIPDQLTIPLLWIGLLVNINDTFTSLEHAVVGAAGGYLVFWLFAKLFHMITRKEGMGHGDFKLLAMFGAWVGWQMLPGIILISSFTGAIVGCINIGLRGKNKNTPIPFGPFIAFAGWISVVYGNTLLNWYLNLFR